MKDIGIASQSAGWHWKDLVRTYSFWGLVLISFFMGFSINANYGVTNNWVTNNVSYHSVARFINLGILTTGLLTLYFLRTRLKSALIIFTLLYLSSLVLMRFAPDSSTAYLTAIFFNAVGHYGVLITLLAALVSAKLPLQSFLIAVFIIYCGNFGGGELELLYLGVEYNNLQSTVDTDLDVTVPPLRSLLYHLSFLAAAALAVLVAAFLKSKMFFEAPINRPETTSTSPPKAQPAGWLWQDLVSTYRFWGLVLISFLIAFTQHAHPSLISTLIEAEVDFEEVGKHTLLITALIPPLVASFLTFYFLRGRIKAPLIGFCLLYLTSFLILYLTSFLIRFGFTSTLATYMAAQTLREIGYYAVILTILSILITARLSLKTFLIAFFIIWFWSHIGQTLGYAYQGIDFRYTPIDDKGTPPASYIFFAFVLRMTPAALAVVAASFLNPKMFFEPPNIDIEAKDPPAREASEVFVFSLIVPFYFLVWLFNQPRELKKLAPDMHQPSPIGALCTGLFAPMVLPIWFHDVRKGLGSALKDRSPSRIGVAGFFMPAIAAGMAQSDYNQIVNDNSDST